MKRFIIGLFLLMFFGSLNVFAGFDVDIIVTVEANEGSVEIYNQTQDVTYTSFPVTVQEGDVLEIEAISETGFSFTKFEVSENSFSPSTHTINPLIYDTSGHPEEQTNTLDIKVFFEEVDQRNIDVIWDSAEGNVSVYNETTEEVMINFPYDVEVGDVISFIVNAEDGYVYDALRIYEQGSGGFPIDTISETNFEYTIEQSSNFIYPYGNMEFVFNFEEIEPRNVEVTYLSAYVESASLQNVSTGQVLPFFQQHEILTGDVLQINVVPIEDYHVSHYVMSYTKNNEMVDEIIEGNPVNIEIPYDEEALNSDILIFPVIEQNPSREVDVVWDGGKGFVQVENLNTGEFYGSFPDEILVGHEISFEIFPEEGYYVDNVEIVEPFNPFPIATFDTEQFTFEIPEETSYINNKLYVLIEFKPEPSRAVNFAWDNAKGTVSVLNSTTEDAVLHGDKVSLGHELSFVAYPEEGHFLAKVDVYEQGTMLPIATFSNETFDYTVEESPSSIFKHGDLEFVFVFEEIPSREILVWWDNAKGTVSVFNETQQEPIIGATDVEVGDEISIIAYPEQGFDVKSMRFREQSSLFNIQENEYMELPIRMYTQSGVQEVSFTVEEEVLPDYMPLGFIHIEVDFKELYDLDFVYNSDKMDAELYYRNTSVTSGSIQLMAGERFDIEASIIDDNYRFDRWYIHLEDSLDMELYEIKIDNIEMQPFNTKVESHIVRDLFSPIELPEDSSFHSSMVLLINKINLGSQAGFLVFSLLFIMVINIVLLIASVRLVGVIAVNLSLLAFFTAGGFIPLWVITVMVVIFGFAMISLKGAVQRE